MHKLSCYCGYLVITDQVCDSENKSSSRKINIMRFDPMKKQMLNFVSSKIPPHEHYKHGEEFVIIQQEAFEAIDLDSNLKNLYVLLVLKSDSDSTKIFVRLFCLVNFKYLRVCVEFELPIPSELYENQNMYVTHGPLVCYADRCKVYLVGKSEKFQVLDDIVNFELLNAKCIYKKHLKRDQLNIIGISHVDETHSREASFVNLVITFGNGELTVRKQLTRLISYIYASIVTSLYIRSIREEIDSGDDDDISGDVVVATSHQQLIYFKNKEFMMASDLPFADASKIIEFCSSSGKTFFFVQSSKGSCCVVDANTFEIRWTLHGRSEEWIVLVDDFVGQGSRQVLFLKLQANKKPDVLTIIDDLDDDDDDNDNLDVDNDPKNKTPDVFTIINDLDADDDDFADNDPKNWKYFLNDFSGLECSNNLTKKEKETFNALDDDDDDDDDDNDSESVNLVPAVVLEAVDRKYKDTYLKLEEAKKEKHSKMKLIREVQRSITDELAGVPTRCTVSCDLVNLMDDSIQNLQMKIIDDESKGIERHDSNADIEIVDKLWQGIFENKWIVVVYIRNNTNTRKIFNISLSCLGTPNRLHVCDNNSPGRGESLAFKLKGTGNKVSNMEFILDCLNKYKSNSQSTGSSNMRHPHSSLVPQYLCSKDYELLNAPLCCGEECYVVCSQDVPLLIDTQEISCAFFLHWNETIHSEQNVLLASNEDFIGDVLFAKSHVKHVSIVKLSDQSFTKLMFDPKMSNVKPECMSMIYAVFLAALNFTKLEIKSSFCNDILNDFANVLLGRLKFNFVQQYGFFWSEGTGSLLSRCAVFVTKAASYSIDIVVFFGSSSNLGYFLDKLYDSFARDLEVKVKNSLQENESIERVFENLKKEALLSRESPMPVFHSTDSEQDKGNEISDIRAKFEKRRTMMDDLGTRDLESVSQHAIVSAVECLRSTDRAVALLSSCFEKSM